jgi:hypothetical protein
MTRRCAAAPERHLRDAIAGYPRDAIVDAIAIFSGKRTAGALPRKICGLLLLRGRPSSRTGSSCRVRRQPRVPIAPRHASSSSIWSAPSALVSAVMW